MKRFELHYESTNQILGQGSFGQVFMAKKRQTGEQVAVKTITKSSQLAMAEVEILNTLSKHSHPNIMRVLDIFDIGQYIYIVQEYCNAGTLYDYLKNQRFLPEEQSIEILDQISSGLEYLHAINIVHRDIKPENILRHIVSNQSYYKITDFGLSSQNNLPMKSKFGTAYYVAPEIINGKADKDGYDKSVDVWALGIMFDELLHGSPFYDGESEEEIYIKIRNEPYYVRKQEYNKPNQKRNIVQNILNGMVQREIYNRWSLAKVRDQCKQYKIVNQQQIALMFSPDIDPLIRTQSQSQFTSQQQQQQQQYPYQQLQFSNKCSLHNLALNFRMPIKTNDNDGKLVAACIKCLKQLGVYDQEGLVKKVDEALQILSINYFESSYNVDRVKQELLQIRNEQLTNRFVHFTVRDEHLQIQYDQILNETMQQAKQQYQNRIKQLTNFKDQNYVTKNNEELWIVYVAEKIQDEQENEFVMYIEEEIEQSSEHGIEDCKNLIHDLLNEAILQLQKLC